MNRSASRGILYCWAVLRGSALRLPLLPAFLEFIQFLQFLHKFFDVPERPIDGCKSYIRDVIHLSEFLHDSLAYVRHLNFFFRPFHQFLLDGIGYRLNPIYADGPLFAGSAHPFDDLSPVELLPTTVFLNDVRQDLFYPLVSRKPFLAVEALTASSNH